METLDQLYLEPVEMIAGDDVVQIASGFAFSLALNKGGIIHAWGKNNEGQLGAGVVSLSCVFCVVVCCVVKEQLEGWNDETLNTKGSKI
jgi:alpha-tubulin suppressor-like RCC1 family protein